MAGKDLGKMKQAMGPVGLVIPADARAGVVAPKPDAVWKFRDGSARVWYGKGNNGIVRPVLLADGFNMGPTDFDWLWEGLDSDPYRFITQLRDRQRDVVLIGFNERSESILVNAEVAKEAIMRAMAERMGDERLVVGGFSMGGLVTRLALAQLETQRIDHQTGVYLSFDSPHRGASVPIALQAIAHHLAPVDDTLARQINSPASRELLWRHLETVDGTPRVDPARRKFLEALERAGGWPQIPRLIGVANGVGDGRHNGIAPGVEALRSSGPYLTDTVLYTQAGGRDRLVADLRGLLGERKITTNDFPDIDGAPGGTLDSFGILADALKEIGEGLDVAHRTACFVPSVSAVSVRGVETNDDLYVDINALPPEQSDLDDFLCSSRPTPHTAMTEELGQWIVDRVAISR
ncbi:hypothetical protein ACG83_33875 [Frankia sp. R43]|uniref:esterase/lipase family protein n=1 Tax=Frankia sp. R43 TaxID=269536 RepID=UPI0006CA0A94|nr:hypothetical protein [Frankia sp. R43]KPM51793.1 hypothetical protein ACG83_33875 [Frankia sp. R43]